MIELQCISHTLGEPKIISEQPLSFFYCNFVVFC